MTFRPDVVRGAPSGRPTGVIDFRLQRNGVVKEYKKGRLSRLDVCDAHPELLRNAEHASRPSSEPCPICEAPEGLVLVTYVFGAGLPPSGRCILSDRELSKMARGKADLAGYLVEVCRACNWNHLLQSFPVGGGAGGATRR